MPNHASPPTKVAVFSWCEPNSKWFLMPKKIYVPKSLRDVSMSLILQKTLFFVWKNLHTTLTRVIQWCTEDVLMDQHEDISRLKKIRSSLTILHHRQQLCLWLFILLERTFLGGCNLWLSTRKSVFLICRFEFGEGVNSKPKTPKSQSVSCPEARTKQILAVRSISSRPSEMEKGNFHN